MVTIGSIHGGNRGNIIPEQVEMMGTVRTLSTEDEKMFIKRINEIVTHTAEAAGATAEVKLPYTISYPVTYNDPALTAKMLPSLRKAAGDKNVIDIHAVTGAEDYAFYQQKIPGLFYFVGITPPSQDLGKVAINHSPKFFVDESGLLLGIRSLASLAVDYLQMGK